MQEKNMTLVAKKNCQFLLKIQRYNVYKQGIAFILCEYQILIVNYIVVLKGF
jgi:nucleoid-associated protein YejK